MTNLEPEQYQVKAAIGSIEEFEVLGISIITDNNKAAEDINALWERFFKESIGQQVSNKESDVIYAVYSDYEGDHTKPYRLTIGYRITAGSPPSEKLHCVKCITSDYAILSATGQQPKALIDTWQSIWESDLDRAYKTDFELYGPRFFEDGINEVLVHIGLKEEEKS